MASVKAKYDFTGKRALVTGASRGIGQGIAVALAAAGAETYALAKTKENLDKLVAEHPGIKPICVDISDWNATRAAVEQLGRIDLLVNNAGISVLDSFLEVKPEDLEQIFQVNVMSVLNVSQVVSKRLVELGAPGCIVNISSKASVVALHQHTAYCTSKAALDMMTKMMALELGPKQIRVNSVNPTVTMTDMGRMAWSDPGKGGPVLNRIPLGKFAEVEDVVEPVLFLLSDSSAMINGASVMVDGGFSIS